MLKLRQVYKGYNGGLVLKGVSLDIKPGERLGLVGPSGSGKSLLLKIIGGVEKADSGGMSFYSSDGQEVTPHVGFLFQEGALFDSMSVLENVAFPLFSSSTGGDFLGEREKSERREIGYELAYDILAKVGLSAAALKLPGQISGGMRRRVGIARALVSKPEIVLLDDPTGGLDPVAASVIMSLIRDLHGLYAPIMVLVSHDLRRLLPSVERVVGLFDGTVCCDSPVDRLVESSPKFVIDFLSTRYDFEERA